MVELTKAQRRVHRELTRLVDMNGYCPSVRELAAACGRSPSTVHTHLGKLVELGVIERVPKVARAIKIIRLA